MPRGKNSTRRRNDKRQNKYEAIKEICRLAEDYDTLMQERNIAEEGEVEDTRNPEVIDEEIDSIMLELVDAARKLRSVLYPDDQS